MDQAAALTGPGPLGGKIGALIAEMADCIAAEAGTPPSYVKVCAQMPDDSVLEARGELCPDGCGQVAVTSYVVPRLASWP